MDFEFLNKNGYSLVKYLGGGYYRKIYKVKKNNKEFAIKISNKKNSNEAINEFNILKNLNSLNVIRVFEAFNLDGFYCILMECLEINLDSLIGIKNTDKKIYGFDDVFKWTKDILNGLNYLQFHRIVHRNIIPMSLLLYGDNIKIASFSFSVIIQNKEDCLEEVKGTWGYISPEILNKQKYDFKTDIWSCGCVLFELLFLKKFSSIKNCLDFQVDIPKKFIILLTEMLTVDKHRRPYSSDLITNINSLNTINNIEKLVYLDLFKTNLLTKTLPKRNEYFVGRETLITKIDDLIFKEDSKIILIYSNNSNGNSTLALEYGYRFNETNNHTYWIQSENENLIIKELKNLALEFGLITSKLESLKDLLDMIKSKLLCSSKILFIFDNYADSPFLHECIDSLHDSKNIFVLLASSTRPINEKYCRNTIEVNGFDLIECRKLIIKMLRNYFNDKDLEIFAEEIQNAFDLNIQDYISPFNINVMINYLNYKSKFVHMKMKNTLVCLKSIKLEKSISADRKIIEKIIKNEDFALKILKYMSLFETRIIPIGLNNQFYQIKSKDFKKFLDLFSFIGIITTKEMKNYNEILMCTSFHKILKQIFKFNDFKLEKIYKLVFSYFDEFEETKNILKENQFFLFYHHLKSLIDFLLDSNSVCSEDKADLAFKFGVFINSNKISKTTLKYLEKAIELSKKNSKDILKICGIVNYNLGYYDDAIKNFKFNFDLLIKDLNNDNSASDYDDKILALTYLAEIYFKLNQFNFALDYLNECLNISRLKNDTLQILINLNRLNLVYYNLGNIDEAEKCLIQSREIFLTIVNSNRSKKYLEVLITMGKTYFQYKNFAEALGYFEKSFEIFNSYTQKNVIENELILFDLLNNIGLVYYDLMNYERALGYFYKAGNTIEKINDDSQNLNQALYFNYIGLIYFKKKNYQDALENLQASFEIKKNIFKTLAFDDIANNLDSIGLVYYELGLYEKALNHFEQSLSIKQSLDFKRYDSIDFSSSKIVEIKQKLTESTSCKFISNSYEFLEKIGQGGFGTVYKAKNISNNKIYAIKAMTFNSHSSRMINEEISILNRINSPFLLNLADEVFYIDDGAKICLVMEYFQAGTLKDFLDKKMLSIELNSNYKSYIQSVEHKNQLDTVYKWSKDIIYGLNYLHYTLNIIHRDLKPENILISEKNLKIADFGISREIDSQTLTNQIGTSGYKSPEILAEEKYGFNTDIWSAGCVIFQLISLKLFKKCKNEDFSMEIKLPGNLCFLLKVMLIYDHLKRPSSKKLTLSFGLIDDLKEQKDLNFEDLYKHETNLPEEFLKIYNTYFKTDLVASEIPLYDSSLVLRNDYLIKIDSNLKQHNVCVLYSDTNNGKSSVALQYAHNFLNKDRNNYAYWIDFKQQSFENFIDSFSIKLKRIENKQTPDSKDDLKLNSSEFIQNYFKKLSLKSILFIFDNCNVYENYLDIFRNFSYVFILITSRKQLKMSCNYYFSVTTIKSFEKEDCLNMIKMYLEDKNVTDFEIHKLIELCSLNPFILKKLLIFINVKIDNSENIELNELINDDDLLQKVINKQYLIAELQETFDEIKLDFLKYISLMACNNMAIDIFMSVFKFRRLKLYETILMFNKYRIISYDESKQTINLDRFIQDEIYCYLKNNNQIEYLVNEMIVKIENYLKKETINYYFLTFFENIFDCISKKENFEKLNISDKLESIKCLISKLRLNA